MQVFIMCTIINPIIFYLWLQPNKARLPIVVSCQGKPWPCIILAKLNIMSAKGNHKSQLLLCKHIMLHA